MYVSHLYRCMCTYMCDIYITKYKQTIIHITYTIDMHYMLTYSFVRRLLSFKFSGRSEFKINFLIRELE